MAYDQPMDFNTAEPQSAAFAPIPHGTLARMSLAVKPGGAGPDGWLTRSRSSEALYLSTEAVVLEGEHARRRVLTRIGLKGKSINEKGEDTYANRGRALIRALLESARGIRSDDQSERARAARTIRSYGDLNGLVFVARIVVEADRTNPNAEPRNAIGAALGPDRPEYAALMGTAAAPAAAGSAAGAGATPPWAAQQPAPAGPAAAADPAGDGGAPFWAR
jgi:hypothetical protein